LRLIHAADYGGPYAGSFIPMLRAVLGLARRRGSSVQAVFSEVARGRAWLQDLERDGIPVRLVSVRSRAELSAELSGLLAAEAGPCVLHTHFSSFDLPAVRAARGRPDTAILWHLHTPLQRGPKPWLRNAVRFSILGRDVRRMLCVAPDLARDVRRRLGPASRVEFFPNAIDTRRFGPVAAAERGAARAALGLPADAPLVAHFGWDWRRKGGDLYLRAIARLAERGRDGLLAVTVGSGEEARREVAELGLDGLVRVLDPVDRVEDVYAAADVFASPSRAEGMPFSVAEALARGTAVVASDIPGQRFVGGEVEACLLTPLEPAAIADAIESLLDRDPGRVAAEAEAARAWIVENMDVQVWAERLLDLYETVLGRPPDTR